MNDCDKYPPGSRRRALCDGTANLPPAKLKAIQAALAGGKPAVGVPAVTTAPRAFSRNATGMVATRVAKDAVHQPTHGPGSELIRIFAAAGVPSCKACKDTAAKMDRMGVAWCRDNLDWLVEEILPRAMAWVADNMPWTSRLLPKCVKEFEVRRRIRGHLTEAIDQAEANPTPAPAPSVKKNLWLGSQNDAGRSVRRAGHRPAIACAPLPEPPLVSVTPADVIQRCEVIVKSFRRHGALEKFLRSLWARYPRIPVVIADDSFEEHQPQTDIVQLISNMPDVRWLQMPFDSGLSAGRNLCVQEASRDIIILADDDYVVTEETRLERLVAALDARSELSLVAGCIRNGAGMPVTQWAGDMVMTADTMIAGPLKTPWRNDGGVHQRDADLVWNFFAARRESLLSVPWDNNLKIAGEHVDFFMSRKKQKHLTAFTDECIIVHQKQQPAGYSKYRNRTAKFYDMMKKKWGLKRVGSPSPMTMCGERNV